MALSPGAVAGAERSPSEILGQFHATRTGVDAAGNFWLWHSEERRLTSFTPAGIGRAAGDLPEASAVDADSSRGVLALTDAGRAVRSLDWEGRARAQVSLTHPASNVCWLSGDEFAVAPLFTAHLIEVWNLRTREMVRTMVPVPAVVRPARGAVLARTTLLRYDSSRRELIAGDAVTGVVRVIAADGRVVRTASLPEAVALRDWLRQVDADSRARGESAAPSMWHYTALTVADDGSIWIGEEYDERNVRAARITRAGKVERQTFAQTCPSLRFEAWQGHFVFYQNPRSPRPPCVGVRRQ